ncbi:hypothetical protein J4032_09440 [Streptomyces formicae]|uniref:Uncharacterized protein n=2 Tax=Streptomyces formicae TaxID=1616117 RepID=A0ABY3WPJ5_9ACTN|nr:hypothetical protein [Streptomyces formicae]UNM11738.1 hypothetical protein J4032_09440 [Streptomyces formicae]
MQQKEQRLDLSVTQVAGSALAAVAAAVLASQLGVYGTIIGAGVVSIVATCGGPVLQQLFRRTGQQLRDATKSSGPAARAPQEASTEGEFGEATTYGTRIRGRKRSVIAAAVVFAVAMAGITAYELASGRDLSGGTGTTVGSVVRGGGGGGDSSPSGTSPQQNQDDEPTRTPGSGSGDAQSPDGEENGQGAAGTDAGTDAGAGRGTGDGQGDGDSGATEPTPGATPSPDGEAATPTPTPTPTPTSTPPTPTPPALEENGADTP